MKLSASLRFSPLPGWSNNDGARGVSVGVMPIVVEYQRPDTHDTMTPGRRIEARAHVRAHVGHGVSWCHGVRSISSSDQIERKDGGFRARPGHDTRPDTLAAGVRSLNIGVKCPYQRACGGELGDLRLELQQLDQVVARDNLVDLRPGAGARKISGLARPGSAELDSAELDSRARPLAPQRYRALDRLITDQPALPPGTRRSDARPPGGAYPPLSIRSPYRPPSSVLSPIRRTLPANWQRPEKQTPDATGRGSGWRGAVTDSTRAADLATLARRFGEVKPRRVRRAP